MTTTSLRFDSRRGHGTGAQLMHAAGTVINTLALWQARHVQRRALAELTADQLGDIGVSAGDAAAEANKPFWRA